MQFRERAKVIQLIRTVYDPAIKRGRSELVGRLDKDAPRIDETVRRVCSPAELDEIQQYLDRRALTLTADSMRDAALGLPAAMRLAESYFRQGGGPEAGRVAADIVAAWDDLKKALHKGGFRNGKAKT